MAKIQFGTVLSECKYECCGYSSSSIVKGVMNSLYLFSNDLKDYSFFLL